MKTTACPLIAPPWPFTRTRLAPSPTGALHLGHARTFLITWWLARQAGAEIVLRMEDLDAGRARPDAIAQTYEDLRWLGMDWDRGPEEASGGKAGDVETFVQSHRLAKYGAVLEALWTKKVIYPCTCTRAEIAAAVAASVGAPQEGDALYRYEGICRERWIERAGQPLAEVAAQVARETGKKVCWRLRVAGGVMSFVDQIAGAQGVDVWRDVGDFPLTRFEGPPPAPAYQLACVADDHAMGIDAVIRGDDLLASTPRQLLIYQAMGWRAPAFAHVPLVIGADGKRLAKRHGESRIAQFRAAGVPAETMVGWVAWRSGQVDKPRPMRARELIAAFDLSRLPHERVVIGPADLAYLHS